VPIDSMLIPWFHSHVPNLSDPSRSEVVAPSAPQKAPIIRPLLPPPVEKSSQSVIVISQPETVETTTESDEIEGWGWGEFVHHTEDFAEFSEVSPPSSDDVNESIDVNSAVMRCLDDLIAIVGAMSQDEAEGEGEGKEHEVASIGTEGEPTSESSERSLDGDSPNFVLVSETEEASLERESSTESERSTVVVSNDSSEPFDSKENIDGLLECEGEGQVPVVQPSRDSSSGEQSEALYVFPNPEEICDEMTEELGIEESSRNIEEEPAGSGDGLESPVTQQDPSSDADSIEEEPGDQSID
jgi:hypothetical protein